MTQEVIGKYVGGECFFNVTGRTDTKMTKEAINEHKLGVMLVQKFSLKAGTAKFGNRAKMAVTKELTQLHDMKPYIPVDPDKMTPQQRQEALNSVIFLIEKWDMRIKS